jgi:hypothetical protein
MGTESHPWKRWQSWHLAIRHGYCRGYPQQSCFLCNRVRFPSLSHNTGRFLTNDSNSDVAGDLNDPTGPPASGKVPISTLGQAIVNIGVDTVTGKLTKQDYFIPVGYMNLNKGDKDFSSSGVTLLDPIPFSGGGVNRVALAGSKVGTVYIVDADNLGGYKNGA